MTDTPDTRENAALSDALKGALIGAPHDENERTCKSCDTFCCTCELCDCCRTVNPTLTAAAILALPEMQWLRQFLVDTLNTDFLSAYQAELVGEVPSALLSWADIDADWGES